MPFDYAAPLDQVALDAAAGFHRLLPDLKPGMYFDHIVLHWSAEEYHCTSGSYNAMIVLDDDNDSWLPKITHDPLDNAVKIADGPYAAHTLGRNSHGLGISVAATGTEGGSPLQYHQLDMLLATAAAVGRKYNVQVGEQRSLYTHAECAVWDGYPNERIDLGRVDPSNAPLTVQERFSTGNALRARCHAYGVRLRQILGVAA
ncbi:MAG: hypothetical protein ACR2KS_10080 [Candidatus Eremiobacter antarcticus]|nr:hypothetical protein [Candidatus Eremiobacteraeota bacterium]MBC5808781.1 hypothetical protein [Candidatus Eremiobacteraeota bacterium]